MPAPGSRSRDSIWSAWIGLFEEVFLCRAVSGQLMFTVLLCFIECDFLLGHLVRSNCCRSCSWHVFGPFSNRPFNVLRVLARQFDEGEVHPRNKIPLLEIPAQVGTPADLR